MTQYTETLESGVQKNAESCENSKKYFTEYSDLMNTLTSVSQVPYLSITALAYPAGTMKINSLVFRYACVPALRCISKQYAE